MKNGFLRVFRTEWYFLLRSPKRLFYVLVFPLVLFYFLAAMLHEGVPRDLPIAYLDHDQSQMSAKLVRMIDAAPSISTAVAVTTDAEAKKLMQQHKIYAFVTIPANFQKRIYQGLTNDVICYTNNQYILPAGLIQKEFQKVVGTFSAGIGINKATQKGDQVAKAYADQVPVRTDVHMLFNPYSNYAYYLLIAFFPMILHMVAMMITVYVIGLPLKYQSEGPWLAMANNSAWNALWGKLLPYTICLIFVSWWMNYLLFRVIEVPLQTGMLNVTLLTILMVFIYQILGVVIVSITKDLRAAMTIGSGFTALALSFAAYTFPMEGLPKSMQYLAQIFPFTHYLKYYVNRAVRGIPVEFTIESLLVLVGFVLLFVLTFPLFVKRIQKGGYE